MTALLFLHCGPQPDTFLKAEPSSFNCSPYFLSFILSHLLCFLLIVWIWFISPPCSLISCSPHLFSLKQFTCKTSTHTVTSHFLYVLSSLILDYLETMSILIVSSLGSEYVCQVANQHKFWFIYSLMGTEI